MANADYSVGSGIPGVSPVARTISNTIDFSLTNHVTNDVLTLFTVPAGVLMLAAVVTVLTPEGATLTLDIGDANVDAYIDGADGNVAGSTVSGYATTEEAHSNGEVYDVETDVTMTILNNAATAKIKVSMVVIDI